MKKLIYLFLILLINHKSFAQTITVSGASDVAVNNIYVLNTNPIFNPLGDANTNIYIAGDISNLPGGYMIHRVSNVWKITLTNLALPSYTDKYTFTSVDANNPPCNGSWTKSTSPPFPVETLTIMGACFQTIQRKSLFMGLDYTGIPQSTTTQITAIANPPTGSLVYDMNNLKLQLYRNNAWEAVTTSSNNFWVKEGAIGNEIKNTNAGGFWSSRATGAFTSPIYPAINPPIKDWGTRLMWMPNNSAFRVGTVGHEWDNDNADNAIGSWSFASGYRLNASGNYSTAFGNVTFAKGESSVALGAGSVANGSSSTAFGNESIANGQSSTAGGYQNTANLLASVALGYTNVANGQGAVSMGQLNIANGNGSVALGVHNITSSDVATSLGYYTKALGPVSTAMGNYTSAGKTGYYNRYATSMGNYTVANGDISTAMGNYTIANGTISTAIGSYTKANGNISTAIGIGSVSNSYASLSFGSYNDTLNILSPSATTWVSTDPLLLIGNGTSDISRSNLLEYYKNGNLKLKTGNLNVQNGNVEVSGNVGIGISPQAKLHVNGDMVLKTTTIDISTNAGVNISVNRNGASIVYLKGDDVNIPHLTDISAGVDGMILHLVLNENTTIKMVSNEGNIVSGLPFNVRLNGSNGGSGATMIYMEGKWRVISLLSTTLSYEQ